MLVCHNGWLGDGTHVCRCVQAWHGPLVSSWLDNRGRWWNTALVDSYQDAGCYGTQHGRVLDNRRRWGRHWSGALRKSCHPPATSSLMMHSTMCLLHSATVYQPVYSSPVPTSVKGYCCFSASLHWCTIHPGCLKASLLKQSSTHWFRTSSRFWFQTLNLFDSVSIDVSLL